MLAQKSNQKSMSTSKGDFSNKYWKTNEKSIKLGFQGIEVGMKIHPKIDQKSKPEIDVLMILGAKLEWKINQTSQKIDAETK